MYNADHEVAETTAGRGERRRSSDAAMRRRKKSAQRQAQKDVASSAVVSSETVSSQASRLQTAHNWELEKKNISQDFFDDGTLSYFWRSHTITVLFIFCAVLIYVAIYDDPTTTDRHYNTKRGLGACVAAFLLLGVTQVPDGPFIRPHPVVWRFLICASIVYELSLIFLLFQTPMEARQLMSHLDDTLGVPLQERAYGDRCLIYDPAVPEFPFHNVWDTVTDFFTPAHFFGWWVKTLILRDWWLCMVISILFEVLEYTLEHQLPNFSECWWDHWILDVLLCNTGGIFVGMYTMRYLSMKNYHWRGMWKIDSYRGRLKRVVAQFGPYVWLDFDWKPTASLKRWFSVIGLIGMFSLAELDNFYLKYVLWIPPDHWLCMLRAGLFAGIGAVAMRETFQYLDDPCCKRLGQQSFITACIIVSELLIVVKFDPILVTKPIPAHMQFIWLVFLTGLAFWTLYHFYLSKKLHMNMRWMRGFLPASAYSYLFEAAEATQPLMRVNGAGEMELKFRSPRNNKRSKRTD